MLSLTFLCRERRQPACNDTHIHRLLWKLGLRGELAEHKGRLCALTVHAFIVNSSVSCACGLPCGGVTTTHVDQELALRSMMQWGVSCAWTVTRVIIWCWTLQNRQELICVSYTYTMYKRRYFSKYINYIYTPNKAPALSFHTCEQGCLICRLQCINETSMTAWTTVSIVWYWLPDSFVLIFIK